MRLAAEIAVLLSVAAIPPPGCGGPPAPYDPCAGKACGDACHPCPPGSDCVELAMVMACDSAGTCSGFPPAVATCHDPCAGKTCGMSCDWCPPESTSCPLRGQGGACDPQGRCVSSYLVCPPAEGCHVVPVCPR